MIAVFVTFREMTVEERDLIKGQLQVQTVVHVNPGAPQSSLSRGVDFIVFGVPVAECPERFLLDMVFPHLIMRDSFFMLVRSAVVPFSNDVVAGIIERVLRNTPPMAHIDILKQTRKEFIPRRQKRFWQTSLEDDRNYFLTDPPGDFEYDPKTGKVSFTMAKPGREGIHPEDLLAFVRAWSSYWGGSTTKAADVAMHAASLILDLRASDMHAFSERERYFKPPRIGYVDAELFKCVLVDFTQTSCEDCRGGNPCGRCREKEEERSIRG